MDDVSSVSQKKLKAIVLGDPADRTHDAQVRQSAKASSTTHETAHRRNVQGMQLEVTDLNTGKVVNKGSERTEGDEGQFP